MKKKSTKGVSFSLNRTMNQSRDDHIINSVTGLEANTINTISVVTIN